MYTPEHILSKKSARQRRNVFIWCGNSHKIAMGLHVDSADAPTSVSTVHRWITTILHDEAPNFVPEPFALFPVDIRPSGILRYMIQQSGSPLVSRETHMVPGDYGIYNEDGSKPSIKFDFTPSLSYADWERAFEISSVALSKKASLPSSIAELTLVRDKECVFTGVPYTRDAGNLVAAWIFPPSLGYTLADDSYVERTYHDNPDACNLSEFMVVSNAVSGRRDVVALFRENKLGIDVDDNYRIVIFDGSERLLKGAPVLKSHATFSDGQNCPSDRYLRLHFQRCLTVSASGGNPLEDYKDQEIDLFMEELGVYDDEIDTTDPRWGTELGVEVYTANRQKR